MKNILIILTVGAILLTGVFAYAHGRGYWGGGHQAGWGSPGAPLDTKFLDETADLRKELHERRFEYAEAVRDPDTSAARISELENKIGELQDKIRDKYPGRASGYGAMRGNGCW